MTRMERLARRLCWMGFIAPRRTMEGSTEAAYWLSIPEATREKYREEARWLCWSVDSLQTTKTGPEILQSARVERARERRAA